MRTLIIALTIALTACAGAPPPDNPHFANWVVPCHGENRDLCYLEDSTPTPEPGSFAASLYDDGLSGGGSDGSSEYGFTIRVTSSTSYEPVGAGLYRRVTIWAARNGEGRISNGATLAAALAAFAKEHATPTIR